MTEDKIRLPPISFLSNLPLKEPAEKHGINGLLNEDFKSRPPLLNELITKEVGLNESDDEIIKYYSEKYEIFNFSEEEKHDILQHEKRSRIEKLKDPNYKPFLCYSIIKRLNEIPKKDEVKEPPKKFVKREIVINNDDVLDIASKFPRKYLGSILYSSYPLRSSYEYYSFYKGPKVEESRKNDLVPLLPELDEYINSIVTVRITSYDLTNIKNNPSYNKRSIWGTDIYTDDSDILLMLKHNGFLPIVDDEESSKEDLKQTPGNKSNNQNISQSVKNFRQFINIISGDIHVDLIVLPKLNEYKGIYRNGINSRSWLTSHDGVSLAIYGVRYGEKNSSIDNINNGELKRNKLKEYIELKDESRYESYGDNGWKLSYEAWKKSKE